MLRDRDVPAADPLAEPLDRRCSGEGQLPRHQVVHRTAQAIKVATAIHIPAARLLRRHVIHRPYRDPVGRGECRRVIRFHQDAQPQVEDLDPALPAQ